MYFPLYFSIACVPGLLGLVTGGGHDRLMVLQGDHVQHQLGHGGLVGPQEGLGVPGAVLEFEPDDGNPVVLDGPGDLGDEGGRKGQGGGHGGTEFKEIAAADAPGFPFLQDILGNETGGGDCSLFIPFAPFAETNTTKRLFMVRTMILQI